jgi:hypothetical protein
MSHDCCRISCGAVTRSLDHPAGYLAGDAAQNVEIVRRVVYAFYSAGSLVPCPGRTSMS